MDNKKLIIIGLILLVLVLSSSCIYLIREKQIREDKIEYNITVYDMNGYKMYGQFTWAGTDTLVWENFNGTVYGVN